MRSLSALGELVFRGMHAKGFPVYDRRPLEWLQLASMEVSEAAEEARLPTGPSHYIAEGGKPEGEAIEIADAIMILAAYAVSQGFDLDRAIESKLAYNETRPALHGGKRF